MNGNLNENPLAELVREISNKKLSGRLQLQHDKTKVAIYSQAGTLVYAACNLQDLRLGPYLLKNAMITEAELDSVGRTIKDFNLAKHLISKKRISREQAEQIQLRLVEDILRLALLWTDGTWEFAHNSQLNEEVTFQVDVPTLLLEAARQLPAEFISSRLENTAELLSPVVLSSNSFNLNAAEGFLLSRIESPVCLRDLSVGSGLPESEVQRAVYGLAISGLVDRENWKAALHSAPKETVKVKKEAPPVTVAPPAPKVEPEDTLESFLKRLSTAHSHYEVLNIAPDTVMSDVKNAYYNLARKYHPDRFRSAPASLITKIESAFARITQAYDTLRDPALRGSYDSKLDAQARAARVAQEAPKAAGGVAPVGNEGPASDESNMTLEQRAEAQFKDGFAALELGQRNAAMGLLSAAARAIPTESRYRAYYGRVLALSENTRRLAEAELQAAIKLEPNNAEYRVMLAELYRDLGFKVRARSEAERAVAADQNNRKALNLLKALS